MFDRNCSLLLLALHYSYSLCCCRPGKGKSLFHGFHRDVKQVESPGNLLTSFFFFFPSHVTKQEGATDADLSMLPRYRYQVSNEPSPGDGLMVPVETSSRYLTTERVLSREDAVN